MLWLGAFAFLLWFMITEFRKAQKSAAVITSIEKKSSLRFPGVLICPAAEQLAFETTVVSLETRLPAQVNLGPVFRQATKEAYLVCPKLVTYTSGTYSVTCLNFIQNPVEGSKSEELSCSSPSSQGKWVAPSDDRYNIWSAVKPTSSILATINVVNASKPYIAMLALLYSDKSVRSFPKTFDEYVNTFTMTAALPEIPYSSQTRILMMKQVRDQYPSNTDCSYDYFEDRTATTEFSSSTPTPTPSNSTDPSNDTELYSPASTVSLAYDTLDEESICHRALLSAPDVIGIIGGAIAIVVASTWFLSLILRYCAGNKNNAHRPDDFSSLGDTGNI
jgi:hypothetical protein